MCPSYQTNPVHRNGATGHTQWASSISVSQEEDIFRFGYRLAWIHNDSVFSYLANRDNKATFIDAEQRINFARFIGPSVWHGFPSDVKRDILNLPPYDILVSWADAGVTSRAKISKLRRRQACAI